MSIINNIVPVYSFAETNPWDVESLQAFLCLKCPECIFDTQEKDSFQNHAVQNHPLSMVFFGKILKEENGFGNNFKEHFLADGESYGGSFYSESNDPFVISTNTQCPRTDFDKTFLPRPKTITA